MIFVQVSIYLSRYLEKRLWELNPLKGYQDTLACSLAMNQKSVNVPKLITDMAWTVKVRATAEFTTKRKANTDKSDKYTCIK